MVAKFSLTLTAGGVTVYQDDTDAKTFYYIPVACQMEFGTTLTSFDVQYWGISKEHLIGTTTPDGVVYTSTTGCILAGVGVFDITTTQTGIINKAIKDAFNIEKPLLKPLPLKDTKSLSPVMATTTLQITDSTIPTAIQVASSYGFNIGATNTLFAEFVAGSPSGGPIEPNPQFGMQGVVRAEMQGDPWTVHIKANLSSVWSYVRNKFDLNVGIGWFALKIGVDELTQELKTNSVISIEFKEGSLDGKDMGTKLFEIGTQMLNDMNKALVNGEGLFKMTPNPIPPSIDHPNPPAFLPSFNAAYSRQDFESNTNISYEQTISYTPRMLVEIPVYIALAVKPTSAVAQYFHDMDDQSNPFITQGKVDALTVRVTAQRGKMTKAMAIVGNWLLSGKIDATKFAIFKLIAQTDPDVILAMEATKSNSFAKFYARPRYNFAVTSDAYLPLSRQCATLPNLALTIYQNIQSLLAENFDTKRICLQLKENEELEITLIKHGKRITVSGVKTIYTQNYNFYA